MAEQKTGFWRSLIRRKEAPPPAPETTEERDAAAAAEPAPPQRPSASPETLQPPAASPEVPQRPSAVPGASPVSPEEPQAPPAFDAPRAPDEEEVSGSDEQPAGGWFARLKRGLGRSSSSLTESVTGLFTKTRLDATSLQDLEDILIQADLGVETAMAITDRLSDRRYQRGIAPDELQTVLAEEIAAVLAPVEKPFRVDPSRAPFIVLVAGVNGTGKTTTIGKLSAKLVRDGHKVVLAAGDTFRAAAVEQLKIWGERTGSPVVAAEIGADAAGLVYDAIDTARRTKAEVLLIDTAGRLQNRAELMAELEKVVRVIRRKDESAPHAVLLTLDATTGQNAMNQVEIFGKSVGVTGLVITKLDGTARGGILVAIAAKHKVPVHFVGVGEKVDDLAPFRAKDFARAIAGL